MKKYSVYSVSEGCNGGSAAGGLPATMGHVHGFGSTLEHALEEYTKLTYGLNTHES